MKTSRAMMGAAFWGVLTNAAIKSQALILSIVGAQTLDVDVFGSMMSWIGVLYVTGSIVDFGLGGYLQREIASRRIGGNEVAKHLVVVFRATLGPFLIASGVILLLVRPDHELGWVTIAILMLWVQALVTNGVLTASLLGDLRFRASTVAVSSGRVVSASLLLLLWLVIPDQSSPTTIATALLVGELAGLTMQVGHLPKQQWKLPLRGVLLRRRLGPYALNNLANSSYARGDIPTVGLISGNTAAAIYTPASQVQLLLMTITAVLNSGTVAVVARSTADGDVSGAERLVRHALFVSVGTSILTATAAAVTAPFWVPLLFTSEFDNSVPLIQVVLISVPIAAVHTVLSQTLIALGSASAIARGTLLSLLLGVLALITLSALWGPLGAAIGVIVRDTIFSAYCIWIWRNHRRREQRPAPLS